MSKRRLLIITELYPYPGNIYLGTFITQQLQVLKEYFDITVLTVFPSVLQLSHKQPVYNRYESGLHIVSVPYFPLWLYVLRRLRIINSTCVYLNKIIIRRRLHRVARTLHSETPFDLVHGHEVYIGDEAGPIGHLLGIPSIFTLHSFYYYHTKLFGKATIRLALKNLRSCNRYISVSTIAAESYIKEGLTLDKFSIIPNGVNPQISNQQNQRIVNFAKGRKVLLSVGYLNEDKQFDISIRSFAQLPFQEIVLVIVGIGPDKNKLEALADSLKCGDRILWLGAIEPNVMSEVYQAIDILIHPSVIDSFSMVCLEAISHGKVVICTTLIGICEFTRNGENIITVPPIDVPAVVSAVQWLLSTPSEYERIAKNAYTFGTTMSWQHQASRIVEIYNQLTT